MNLLISDTQIKAKILPGDHAFSFCVPKLWNDSPEHKQCKMFNNFSILQCYELLLLSSRLS